METVSQIRPEEINFKIKDSAFDSHPGSRQNLNHPNQLDGVLPQSKSRKRKRFYGKKERRKSEGDNKSKKPKNSL